LLFSERTEEYLKKENSKPSTCGSPTATKLTLAEELKINNGNSTPVLLSTFLRRIRQRKSAPFTRLS